MDVRGTKDPETTSGYLHGGGRTHFSCQSAWAITFLYFTHVSIDFLKEIKSYFFFEPGPLTSFVLKGLYEEKKKKRDDQLVQALLLGPPHPLCGSPV